ncbi:MAG: septum formation protein Maf [Magnetovibrio sp.]|nr:septum formation protein Maf [Magnetovibrio sp.]
MHAKIILASASQARTQLLSAAGVDHSCDPADLDETALKQQWSGSVNGLARHLAEEKARVVSARHMGQLVIGADQVLALDGAIFDKPDDLATAREQLKTLRGRKHQLISAVALLQDGEVLWSHSQSAALTMRSFSDDFLDDYLSQVGDQVMSSVGAYHLEGLGAQLFDEVDGDYFTVLGLPMVALLEALRRAGYLPL